jgi:5'-nucleotidase
VSDPTWSYLKVIVRLLLTNDDGIEAPGLQALFDVALQLGEPVVVAPEETHSGCSHQVTTDQPIRVREVSAGRFAVGGTPADCVRVGLQFLAPDAAWVLSGINAGGNLGADIYHSGTVAAAREAVLHGWPAVALSQYRKRGMLVDWEQAARTAASVLKDLLTQPWDRGTFWNVNLPHLPPGVADPDVEICPVDPSPLPLTFREESDGWLYAGDYHQRRREPGTDVDVCFKGKIAVTRLKLF